jgi:hypothetical protein
MEPGPQEPTEPFRIVVTGWRYWTDFRVIHDALVYELADWGPFLLGVGDCPTGADDIATRWGRAHLDWPVTVFCAPWERRGKAAGPIRNKFMIDQFRPGLVLAFIHPTLSRGTVNCANYAESQGIAVRRFFGREDRAQDGPGRTGADRPGVRPDDDAQAAA